MTAVTAPTEHHGFGLQVEGVSLAIGEVRILEGVSFQVGNGRATGLIGANGSGKSSLLNVVSGYYKATQGRVRIGGFDTTGMSPHRICARGVGRSFQSIGRIQDLTVREYVALGLEPTWGSSKMATLFGLPSSRKAERAALSRADEYIADFGLTAYADSALRRCPYGVRKISDLLRAIISEPSVLLLDEPTSGVAAGDRSTIAEVIARWRARSTSSVVLVDHDVAFVADIVDELVALSAGRVVDTGPPQDVMTNPEVLATFVGEEEVEGA